jgi:hypothetical protein
MEIELGPLIKEAVERETRRADNDEDDAEGVPVSVGAQTYSRQESHLGQPTTEGAPFSDTPAYSLQENHPDQLAQVDAKPKSTRQKRYDKLRRQKKRREMALQNPHAYRPSPSLSKKLGNPAVEGVDVNMSDIPVGPGAFIGKHGPCCEGDSPTLSELTSTGFRVIEWDGRYALTHPDH